VVDEQLGAAIEELGQRLPPVVRLEDVFVLDRNPGQFPPLPGEFVALPHVLLLGSKQLLAGGVPLLPGPCPVLSHPASLSVLAFTFAYIVRKMANDPFKALAHPTRRDIVERLSGGASTVGEATRGLGVSKPTISRHLKLLEEAGVVSRVVDGRTHRLALRPETLAETSDWIESQRERWERLFDVVGEYLEERKE
jgi:DNA-binding transcriptional ArsR family regulator